MKPYKERIEGLTAQFKEQMLLTYDQGYKDGVKDGNINDGALAEKVNEAYQNGLSDAWGCAKKIASCVSDGGLTNAELLAIFNTPFCDDIFGKYIAPEAIDRIKEYEEQKNSDCSWCVSEYDEIIYTSVNEQRDVRGIVIDINEDEMRIMDDQCRTHILSLVHPYKPTGRRFPEMKKILEQLQEGGAND